MQEKDRLMKMEHLLSNNYAIAGMLIVIDLLLFFASELCLPFGRCPAGVSVKIDHYDGNCFLRYLFPAVA